MLEGHRDIQQEGAAGAALVEGAARAHHVVAAHLGGSHAPCTGGELTDLVNVTTREQQFRHWFLEVHDGGGIGEHTTETKAAECQLYTQEVPRDDSVPVVHSESGQAPY